MMRFCSSFHHSIIFDFSLDMRDSSGVRFYLSDQLRRYDLGYLFLGTQSTPAALAIPPQVERFNVDSYCPPEATRVCILLQ